MRASAWGPATLRSGFGWKPLTSPNKLTFQSRGSSSSNARIGARTLLQRHDRACLRGHKLHLLYGLGLYHISYYKTCCY